MMAHMAPGRVGILSTWQTVCGIADFTANYIRALEAVGHGAEVVPIDRDAQRFLSRRELSADYERLGELLTDFDIVHIQHEFGFFAGAYGIYESIDNFNRLLRKVNGPGRHVIVTFHSVPPFKGARNRLGGVAMEALFRTTWSRRVVPTMKRGKVRAVSHTRFLRRVLVDSGLPSDLISVIPMGSPPPLETENRDEAKAALGYAPADRLLVVMGFVSEYKGHSVALDAMRSLPPEYKLAVVGGPHPQSNDWAYDKVLGRSQRKQVKNRVRVTDYVPSIEMRQYMAAADIVLAPYVMREVGSSAGISMGLSSGRPVIASRIPVFEELNYEEPRVLLSTPDAPSELARRILQLDRDEALKKQLATNALSYVRATSWEKVAQQHLDLYRSV
jgi:glycosyltransferase involved in cell wall biosynthesis